MDKVLDLSLSVAALVAKDPEVKTIMNRLGFENITNPMMLKTVGRYMTIPKGATMKGIPLAEIRRAFEEEGFVIKE